MKYSVVNKIEIIDFLKQELISMEYVNEAHIIGSFVESENYNDIDLIILFNQIDAQMIIEKINLIKDRFKKLYNKSLHISSFSFHESADFERFKSSNSLINL